MVSEGIPWSELAEPLVAEVSPWFKIIFTLFSAFAILVVLNVVNAVFCQSFIASAVRNQKDNLSVLLYESFHSGDADKSGDITWAEFESEMRGPRLRKCLKSLGVDMDDLKNAFSLLDSDGSGSVDEGELVSASGRLMGNAKAIDLAVLTNFLRSDVSERKTHAERVESCLSYLMRERMATEGSVAEPPHSV